MTKPKILEQLRISLSSPCCIYIEICEYGFCSKRNDTCWI